MGPSVLAERGPSLNFFPARQNERFSQASQTDRQVKTTDMSRHTKTAGPKDTDKIRRDSTRDTTRDNTRDKARDKTRDKTKDKTGNRTRNKTRKQVLVLYGICSF
jgi:hypothetical protein